LPVKSIFAQDFGFKTDVSISCSEKYDLVYVFRKAVDSRETEMMQIHLKQ